MSLSGIIHYSHLFTRLKIYHHIYFKGNVVSKNVYKGRKELISVAWSLALLPKIVWDGL